MTASKINKCYICNAVATTREHCPPYSFFPSSSRDNLITVPSCERHNNGNSKDVEYVRNIITTSLQTNEHARRHSADKVMRSFKRSPALLNSTLRDARPILVDGEETAAIPLDESRFNKIVTAMAYAMYFHIFERRWFGSWNVFSPDIYPLDYLTEGIPDRARDLRQRMSLMPFSEIKMPHPEIFACGLMRETDEKFVFEFKFFGGMRVNLISWSFYLNPAKRFK